MPFRVSLLFNPSRTVTLSAQKLDRYREKLMELRQRVGGEVNRVVEAIHEDVSVPEDVSAAPVHLADVAVESVDADVEVLHATRGIFDDVSAALDRIKTGTFGQCVECGGPISEERLNAIPYAPLCVRCAKASRPAADETET
jgi:DnaK suppressor protein